MPRDTTGQVALVPAPSRRWRDADVVPAVAAWLKLFPMPKDYGSEVDAERLEKLVAGAGAAYELSDEVQG